MKKLLAALALVVGQAGMAPAATMTFNNYDFATADFMARNYTEAGITAKGNAPLIESFGRGGGNSLYLADGGWGGPNLLTFSMATLFDAISFDLTPSLFNYFVANPLTGKAERSSFVNVRVQGYDASGVVASLAFDMGSLIEAKTYSLGSAFKNLTSLVVGFGPTPGFGASLPVGPNSEARCTDSPCSRYRLDNVTLAPVPLPAALTLMLSALGEMAFVARRRKVAQVR
jgi:hypothetical protein